MAGFTRKKFDSLPIKRQHKRAADILRLALTREPELLDHYHDIAGWLGLPRIEGKQALYDRYHNHINLSCSPLKEGNFLPHVKRLDTIEAKPPLPVALYLDHLRSAHNVGSILRTAESFGIHNICFSEQTPFANHPKVEATAKGTAPLLNCHQNFEELPRPLIALETDERATPIDEFPFPKSGFTLMLGNEEYGLSQGSLDRADHIVEIPLRGTKNSINVACAFAIAAARVANIYGKG